MTRAHSPSQASREPVWQEALDKTKVAIRHGNAGEAVRSLSAYLGGDPRAFHDALLDLLASATSQMRQQLVDEAGSQRPDFTLDAHDREGKTALDLAVRHNDTEFAGYLLRHGANPERTSLAGAATDMQALVTRWRWQNLLYAELDKTEWTPIDHALNNGRDKKVDDLLNEMGADSLEDHADLWDLAMAEGRHDVLRAMLILRPDALRELAKDKQRAGEWLAKIRRDPGLSAVLKEFPYQSAKRGAPLQLNCTTHFHNTRQPIKCRHLSTYHQEMQALDPKIGFDYGKFRSTKEIANNVQPEIEKTYITLMAQASATHLIDNRKFGQFLARQFQEMEGENKPATRLMLVETTNHSMNLGLMIKEKEGKKSYVVKFFDPNHTTTGTRSKTSSVKTLETQTLADYIAHEEWVRHYYPETKGLSMIFVRAKDGEQTGAFAASGSKAGRRLTTCIDIKDVNAAAMWHFMFHGFTANLKDLQGHLSALSQAQRLELLLGKGSQGSSALFMAMWNGQAEAIKVYSELLLQAEPIPEQQRIELLVAKNVSDVPALWRCMQRGQAEAVKAYGELLLQAGPIPERQYIELLAGKNKEGNPALSIAMQRGQAEAVKAYGELLGLIYGESRPGKRQKTDAADDGLPVSLIDRDRLAELLAGKDADGIPALMLAMSKGNAEAVKAYGKAVQLLPPDKQADLLLAQASTGPLAWKKSGFMSAMQGLHIGAVNAQLQLLVQLAPRLSEGKRAALWKNLGVYEQFFTGAKKHLPPRYLSEWQKMLGTFSELKSKLSNAPGESA